MDFEAISRLSTVTNALKALGIQEDVICNDPSKLKDSISKLIKEFTDETNDKLEAVLSKVDFATLVYVAGNIFASVVGGIASEWYDKVIGEFYNGKIKGGLISLVSGMISVFPGAIMFFQYAAVKSLQINLDYRIRLIRLLKKDLDLIVSVLISYLTLFKDVHDSYDALDKAIKEVTLAIRVLALEISKNNTSRHVVSKGAFISANRHIDKAIDYLGMGGQSTMGQIIERAQRKYNLKTSPPVLGDQFNPVYWVKYFKDLNQEIINQFTGENGKRVALEIARDLFPFFPRFLQLMLVQSQVNQATINLREKTPILTSDKLLNPSIKIFGANITKDVTGDVIQEIYKSALKFFGYESNRNPHIPQFYRDSETKDLTLQDLISRIKSYEVIILSIHTMWDLIAEAARPYIDLTKTAINSLVKTRTDMVSYRKEIGERDVPISGDNYIANKLGWVKDLTLAKGSITAAISDYAGFQVPLKNSSKIRAINGRDVAELLVESNILYEDLQNYIVSKKLDENNNIQKEPIDKGYNLSQTALIKLLGNVAIVASPSKTVELIAELKSIQFTYNKQYKLDRVEIGKCNSYISLLEGSQLFRDIETSVRYYMDSLKKIPTFKEAIEKALKGDLTNIVQAVGDTETIVDSVLTCVGVDIPDFAVSLKALDKITNKSFPIVLDSVEKSLITIKTGFENTTQYILNMKKTLDDAEDYAESMIKIKNSEATTEIPEPANILIPYIKAGGTL